MRRIHATASHMVSESVRTLSHSRRTNAVRFEERANGRRVPFGDVFEDGNQNAERIVAEDGPAAICVMYLFSDTAMRQPAYAVDVQHHVYVRAAIADVDDAVVADEKLVAQALQNGHFAVSGGHAHDGFDLALSVVAKPCAVDPVVRTMPSSAD